MASSDQATAVVRRVRRRRNWSLPILAAGLLLFGAAVGVWHFAFKPVVLRVAVGPAGSEDHKLIQALGQAFAQDGSPARIVAMPTEGSVESIAALEGSKAELAVARGDLNLPRDATSVAILRKNMVVLWSPSGLAAKGSKKEPAAKIKGIDGLAGKRVGVVGRTPANVALLRVILTESGVDPDKVTVVQFGVGQIAELTRDMSLDAFMTVGPLDSKITADAIAATARARGEPRFLPIEVSEAIAQKHPIYDAEEIPGSTFNASPARPDDKIDTVSVNHLLIARKALSESTVGAFTRQLFAVRPSLARDLPSAAKIEKPDTDKDAALPAHPGAAAYIDGTERTFLEKYSDFLWGGILLLSGVGSGGAWLRHYLKHNERDKNARQRDRLLQTIAEVRQADTVDDLARMQDEVDEILRETLDAYDDGAIEAGDLSAVGLVLEQFRHALSDRRAALAAMPAKQQIYLR
ncbi:MAG: transporter substrate-binding protein [Tardiphaga sp.]|uniref:TAXI family TRAP transporter solute-binding subunit n=1 Tax=Tardiphaga sp. TaxID=1926292 RepID=UPI002610A420|nr:TAXI family TRAP transporter solute-binding subunit [Tardiphaga sp.]MDB5501502.1 transporter substrate-binding protein [Tardiphaga sp.]